MELAGKAPLLLEQGRYSELLDLLGTVAADGQGASDAVLWKLRCRAEQGYLRKAAELANRSRESPGSGDTAQLLRLWRGFLALYDTGNGTADDSLVSFARLCTRLEQESGAGSIVSAVAADLAARAECIRFTLSGEGPRGRAAVVARLSRVPGHYRAAALADESKAALRRAAGFAVGGLAADRSNARSLLATARDEAERDNRPLACAKARLALAELDLRATLDGRGDRELPELAAEFDAITECFRAGGHAFGDAVVHWSVARWLLAYGFADGLAMARTAAAEFAAADAPSTEQQVWTALNAWYLLHGDPAASRQAAAEELRLASAMGLTLAAEIRVLDQANQSARSADVAQVRSLLAHGPRTSVSIDAAYRLIKATSASTVGLDREARALIEEIVAELTTSGADLVLGEPLLVLANMLRGRDDDRADALLEQAALLAQDAEAPIDEAKYRAQLAWSTALRRTANGEEPALNDRVTAGFDHAVALLEAQRSLQAKAELATVCELRGQAAFVARNWEDCGRWLTRAEEVARTAGLLPHLAAICLHEGLVLIEQGRSRGPSAYSHAVRYLDESRGLYERIELPFFGWQASFHRALCDIEAARWLPVDQRAPCYQRADDLMERASGLIDQLRRSSEDGDARRQQQTWMAFSVSKQVLYSQGFQNAWYERHDPVAAWRWLERMKGRALLDALGERDTEAARRSEPSSFAEVRDLLAAEENAAGGRPVVVAEYACTGQGIALFAVRAGWGAPRVAQIAIDQVRLQRFAAATFRAPGGFQAMRELPDGGRSAWLEFAPLIAPLTAWTEPDDVVYLVPHGMLHDLPLHALDAGGVPLIERNPVCYVPAASVLRHTLPSAAASDAAPASGPGISAAVFGDPRKNLRHARQEAVAVASLLGVKPVLGGHVTRNRVLRALGTAAVVHFAGHGRLAAADGFASSIELAGVDTLLAADLLGLRCGSHLVVLSGCQTGVGEQRAGDEIVGFTRALLLSGARSILASQWRVADASARDLLLRFYQAVGGDPGLTLADALRQAVRELRAEPEYSELYHWGGFTLAGSWR
jgi:hypothetical protein